ncbi:N-acetyl sugar amidotransferase [Bdellovibrio bacteriovorus]|nr:N-acetyl sugar amidotransferase [Bdellovibrio bacteriovorus]
MNNTYQICTRCIMDTSDPEISFDEAGVCSHCKTFDSVIKPAWNKDEKVLSQIMAKIKLDGEGKAYDSILGLSGGVDSSYVAMLAKQYGLRPLVVHVDAGWNSEVAVRNIENIVKKLGFDLFTEVINWEEIKDLQLSYFKSGVANLDVPQDHAFFAALYGFAMKHDIQYVLSGSNFATESVLPTAWGYDAMDSKQLKAIHKIFGKKKLATYPTISFFKMYIYFPYIKRFKIIKPLNYIDYDKNKAIQEMTEKLGWQYYGGKHYESRFTRFFQGHLLPTRFGFDKKRAHLSSLVLAGQLSRQEALEKMNEPNLPAELVTEDSEFLCKKLSISQEEFKHYLTMPLKTFRDYPSNYELRQLMYKLRSWLRKIIK